MGAAAPLHLSERDRCILRSWADKDRKSALGIRAEIILLGGQGISNAAIARRLGVTRPTVVNWRRRYRDEGVLGLQDRPRPGRRRAVEDVEVILRTLVEPTPAARWSSRLLAERLGVSNGTVARVWRRWGLKPDELHDFRLPTMPAAALGAGDVTGLFCTPRDQILILSPGSGGTSAQLCELVDAFLWNPRACPPCAGPPARILRFLRDGLARHRPACVVTARTVSLRHPDIQRLVRGDPLVQVVCPVGEVGWPSIAALLIGWSVTRGGLRVPESFAAATVQLVDELVRTVADHGVEFSWTREAPALRRARLPAYAG